MTEPADVASGDGTWPLSDNHVHTQWSWDAAHGDMEATCRRAVAIGLPSVAFTEHADFQEYVRVHGRPLDLAGYLEEIDRCRQRFPGLRIFTGVELGEPHRHPDQAAAILSTGRVERVLASVHSIPLGPGDFEIGSSRDQLTPANAREIMSAYFEELLELVRSPQPFQVLAHIDYPKRYWPEAGAAFAESAFEEEYRLVLRALAARDGILEVNTSQGRPPARGLCPGPTVVAWWREEGGAAISFGSDAHRPENLARGFALAREMVAAAGFGRGNDPNGFWRRGG